mgnify:FL=1
MKLGLYQNLEVINRTEFGIYLQNTNDKTGDKVLLPKKEVPDGTDIGDLIEVFIYKDSEDRNIATTTKVPLTLGELALLKVVDVTDIGAFLDWGLLKDLFLPFKEQTFKVKVDDEILVTLYIDKSDRLCASMKIYDYLSTDSNYKKDDIVTGYVYEYIDNFGLFVAVDNKYSAMIPKNELFQPIKTGQTITARVTQTRDDGKLSLSPRKKAHIQMDEDADMILEKLKDAGGFLPYHDYSDAREIRDFFNISKNAFKRAIGRLYKAGTITISQDGIRLL